jgi:hypothetical protein
VDDVDGSCNVAQQVNVMLVDDLDGSEAAETVSFGLDGRQFCIDLSKDHAAALREALAIYVAAARRDDGRTGRRPSANGSRATGERDRIAAVREWAKAHGHAVSDRGRISKAVMEAYSSRDAAGAGDQPSAKKASRKR